MSSNHRTTTAAKKKQVSSSSSPVFSMLWKDFPEVLLYQIASYAVPETERAKFLCTKIATLCKSSHQAIILDETKSSALWELVLAEDYGVTSNQPSNKNKKNRKCSPATPTVRRSCKRLKRCKMEQVKDAHKLLKDNTEIAYFYLWELSSTTTKSNSLTKSKLCGILNEYGPKLMLNKPVSSGGTFLVEVCRSKYAPSSTILNCVQELIERRGSIVNLSTIESSNSSLTPLCVAAVRGLYRVVEYFLRHGACPTTRCSGRFRLHTNSRKSIRCNNSTPLEFAQTMLTEERKSSAAEGNGSGRQQSFKDLIRVIKLLEENEKQQSSSSTLTSKETKKKKLSSTVVKTTTAKKPSRRKNSNVK